MVLAHNTAKTGAPSLSGLPDVPHCHHGKGSVTVFLQGEQSVKPSQGGPTWVLCRYSRVVEWFTFYSLFIHGIVIVLFQSRFSKGRGAMLQRPRGSWALSVVLKGITIS